MKKEKISETSNLVAVFCHNAPKYTHKTNNNHTWWLVTKHDLVTKQKRKIWKMSTGYSEMSFRKKY